VAPGVAPPRGGNAREKAGCQPQPKPPPSAMQAGGGVTALAKQVLERGPASKACRVWSPQNPDASKAPSGARYASCNIIS